MGLFNFSELFKSDDERKKELAQRRRKAIRAAERSKDVVSDKIEELKKERDNAWNSAKDYLRSGQKAAAARALRTVKASDVMMDNLDRKRWVFGQYVTKMEMAKADMDFAESLRGVAAVMDFDPEAIAQIMDDSDIILDDVKDADKIWQKKYEKDINTLVSEGDTIDNMMEDLEAVVALEVSGGKFSSVNAGEEDSIKDDISSGYKRLKELMEK